MKAFSASFVVRGVKVSVCVAREGRKEEIYRTRPRKECTSDAERGGGQARMVSTSRVTSGKTARHAQV